MKMDYFNDDNIVDLFNGFLPDDYFIYGTGFTDVKRSLVFGRPEYFIPVRFCRKHKGVMKCIDGDVCASVRVRDGIVELDCMTLGVDLCQWEGEWASDGIDVRFIDFRDYETLKRVVSYDAKCLIKGCLTVTLEVQA